jgi:ABC-type polysaccharide/polyol phosphate transport system ATPase subunit
MNSAKNNFNPASAAAISLQNISKRYRLRGLSSWLKRSPSSITQNPRDFLALKNISLTIARGESVGVIGRNGCGKSTLLQILAGIIKPTTGGGSVNGEIAALLELGTGFHPDFTGRENISLSSAIMNSPRADISKKIAQIEAFAELGRFMDEPIRTYSSGMLLRLGFACAIAVDPDVLLVDECLSVGDIFFQEKCYAYMREHLSQKTRVLVSHDMQAITTFCSRVLVLEAGAIAFDGSPLDAVEFYLKALHDSHGSSQKPAPKSRPTTVTAPDEPAFSLTEWRRVSPESTGGIGEVKILNVEVRVNDLPFANVIKPNDSVQVRLLADTVVPKSHLLFGYLVRDKLGNAIFGENSAGISGGVIAAPAGQSEVVFEFAWPAIQPGEYFLTLGIGEGRDPIRHQVQCWAHNVHLFNAISPGQPIHCLFNNPLRRFSFSELAAAERD